jgi:hypothetical protein
MFGSKGLSMYTTSLVTSSLWKIHLPVLTVDARAADGSAFNFLKMYPDPH